jgi:hypothetical protein
LGVTSGAFVRLCRIRSTRPRKRSWPNTSAEIRRIGHPALRRRTTSARCAAVASRHFRDVPCLDLSERFAETGRRDPDPAARLSRLVSVKKNGGELRRRARGASRVQERLLVELRKPPRGSPGPQAAPSWVVPA